MKKHIERSVLAGAYPSVLRHIHNIPRRSFGPLEFATFCLVAAVSASTLFSGVAYLLSF